MGMGGGDSDSSYMRHAHDGRDKELKERVKAGFIDS